MARKEIPEINAGSMADIAFLLLIFFLVTTTMDVDAGINRNLPQKPPENVTPPIVKARNVYEVKVNKYDQLLVENELMDISQLTEGVKEFYLNPTNSADLPELSPITPSYVKNKINEMKSLGATENDLASWYAKLDAIQFFGNYNQLPDNAMISLKSDNNTSYEMYIKVQNEIQRAINELRNELTQSVWQKDFSEFKDDEPSDKIKIMAVRQIVPMRVAEAPPKDTSK